MSSELREITPKFDEEGHIIPQQDYCASCKQRLVCEKLKNKIKEINAPNTQSVLLSMYYVCDDFDPMYIQFPITVEKIVSDSAYDTYNQQTKIGAWCAVKTTAEGYANDLHLGIMLGILPVSIISMYDERHATIRNTFNTQPAILVPYYNKIFYGMNMQWQLIEKVEDLDVFNADEPFLDNAKKSF